MSAPTILSSATPAQLLAALAARNEEVPVLKIVADETCDNLIVSDNEDSAVSGEESAEAPKPKPKKKKKSTSPNKFQCNARVSARQNARRKECNRLTESLVDGTFRCHQKCLKEGGCCSMHEKSLPCGLYSTAIGDLTEKQQKFARQKAPKKRTPKEGSSGKKRPRKTKSTKKKVKVIQPEVFLEECLKQLDSFDFNKLMDALDDKDVPAINIQKQVMKKISEKMVIWSGNIDMMLDAVADETDEQLDTMLDAVADETAEQLGTMLDVVAEDSNLE